jgi:hypothetical protein
MFVVIALTVMPDSCAKILGKKPPQPADDPTPPPVPVTSATTPPIWNPPEQPTTPSSAPTSSAPTVSPELVKARAAADAKEFKKVKTLLGAKVLAGKCLPEESQLVFKACVALKDKKCSDAVKAKHPEDITE